jgi:phosphomannomutase
MQLAKQITLRKEDMPEELLGRKVVEIKDYDGIKLICSDESWLMFRGSGTEPIMRVYAEAKSQPQAKKLLEFGSRFILKDAV